MEFHIEPFFKDNVKRLKRVPESWKPENRDGSCPVRNDYGRSQRVLRTDGRSVSSVSFCINESEWVLRTMTVNILIFATNNLFKFFVKTINEFLSGP